MIPEPTTKGVAMVPTEIAQQFTLDPGTIASPLVSFEIEDASSAAPTEVMSDRRENAVTILRRNPMAELAVEYKLRAEANPESALAWVQAGQASLASHDLDSARGFFEKANQIAPSNRQAVLGLARTAHEQGRMEEALDILDGLLVLDPTDNEARVSKAVVLAASGKLDDALALVSGEVPASAESATFLATRGSLLFATHRYGKALSDLRKVIRLKPDWVHAHNLLGLTELRMGRRTAAERRFRAALRIGPLSREPLVNLLKVLRQDGRWKEIHDLVDQFWKPGPAPIDVAMLLADAALRLDDPRSAKEWLEAATEKVRSPEERAQLLNNLGVAYSRLDRLADAAETFRASVETLPSTVVIANRAKALIDDGRISDALDWLLSWKDNAAFGTSERITLAYALALAHHNEQAIQIGVALVEDAQADESSFMLLSMLYADIVGDPKAGANVASKGLTLFPDSASLRNNLAYCLLQAGEIELAEQYLDSVGEQQELTNETKASLRATRGLLALKRGDLATGRRFYEEAAAIAGYESIRERVKAKRDLEVARTLIALGERSLEVARLLERAANAKPSAEPYSSHARSELLLLKAGPS